MKPLDGSAISIGQEVAVIVRENTYTRPQPFEIFKRKVLRVTKTKIVVEGPNIPQSMHTYGSSVFTEFKVEDGQEWGARQSVAYFANIELWSDEVHLPLEKIAEKRKKRDTLWKQFTRGHFDRLPLNIVEQIVCGTNA